MQRTSVDAREVVGPCQSLCGRVRFTIRREELLKARLEVQARIAFKYFLDHDPQDLIYVQAHGIESCP